MKGEYKFYSDEEQKRIFGGISVTTGYSFPVEVFLAMGQAQAQRLGRGEAIAIMPALPDGEQVYFRLSRLPESLCRVKPGWETIVQVPRENIEKVMKLLYPKGLDKKYWQIISAIEGEYITLLGYAD